MTSGQAPLILASQSQSRRDLLEAAGVEFSTVTPRIDEESVKESFIAEGAHVSDIADSLAELKALSVSRQHAGAFVIGADQVLALDGEVFDKPQSLQAAGEQLRALRGQTHELHTAACIARDNAGIWREHTTSKLTMRAFSDSFLDWYMACAGTGLQESVGAYQVEGIGIQLFDRIEGDYFAICGLPLLALLGFLREHAVVMR